MYSHHTEDSPPHWSSYIKWDVGWPLLSQDPFNHPSRGGREPNRDRSSKDGTYVHVLYEPPTQILSMYIAMYTHAQTIRFFLSMQ